MRTDNLQNRNAPSFSSPDWAEILFPRSFINWQAVSLSGPSDSTAIGWKIHLSSKPEYLAILSYQYLGLFKLLLSLLVVVVVLSVTWLLTCHRRVNLALTNCTCKLIIVRHVTAYQHIAQVEHNELRPTLNKTI